MTRRGIVLLAAVLSLAGCTSTTAPVDATGTLFEIEHVNFAWVPTWRGVVIDTAGTVHGFDLSGEPWQTDDEKLFTARELESKWSRKSQERGTVDRSTLDLMTAKAAAAADDLSDPVTRCADAGTITYSVYRYDPARDAFRRIVVRREGDIAQLSESAAGRAVADWLVSLKLVQRIEGCEP